MRLIYPKNKAIMSTLSPLNLGVMVDGVPSGDVDIAISGDEMTTINQTITAQQAQDGYCFSLYGDNTLAGRKPFTVTVSASNGITEEKTFTAYLTQEDEETVTKWTPYLCCIDGYANWRREYPTFTDVSTKRNSLRTDLFGSSSLPTGAPYATTNPAPSSVNGVTLTHAKNADDYKVDFRMNDPDGYYWESSFGYVQNSDNLGILVIDHLGHGEPGHDTLFTALMDAGYDYANCALASATNNPLITESFPTTRHNQILNQGIDRAGFDGRQLFLFDKVRFIDWVLTQKSYSQIILCGVSGGGQMGALWGGVDSRLNKVFACRGTGAQGQPFGGGDFEQGPGTLFDYYNEVGGSIGAVASPRVSASLRNHSRLDWYTIKAAEGNEFHLMWHPEDTCCWKKWYNELFGYDIQDYITEQGWSGSFNMFVNTDAGQTTHGYQAADISYIMANI